MFWRHKGWLAAGLLLLAGRGAPGAAPPGVSNFSQPVTLPLTVSGVDYLWTGVLSFAPTAQETICPVTGTGSLKRKVVPLSVVSASVQPAALTGGQTATLAVALSRAPLSPVSVLLTASDSAVVVPARLTINTGQVSAMAPITTGTVSTSRVVTLDRKSVV